MAYRVNVGGITIECDTVEEAMALAGVDAPNRGAGRSGGGGGGDIAPPPGRNEPAAVRLLHMLVNNFDHGVHVDTLVKSLGLKESRGMGPLMLSVNTQLARIGMSDDDVLQVKRMADGRRYFATNRAAEALAKLTGKPLPPSGQTPPPQDDEE